MTARQEIELEVNGERRRLMPRPADLLLDSLRDELGLTGAKPGCENGDCGACTVRVDGVPTKSCVMLTVEALGRRVQTVEGLPDGPLRRAFVEQAAFQCGYCTSGMLMTCQALIEAHPDADGHRVLEWLRSNLCRCTGYQEINAAVNSALGHEAKATAATALSPAPAAAGPAPVPAGAAVMAQT